MKTNAKTTIILRIGQCSTFHHCEAQSDDRGRDAHC
jgi:hypothetical protein